MGKGIYTRTPDMMTGKYSHAHLMGENASAWKGDNAGYHALHKWIQSRLGKPNKCDDCGITSGKRFEWANISGKYLRDVNDWKRLCSVCHHKMDKITDRGWITRKKKYGHWGVKEVRGRNTKGQFLGRPAKSPQETIVVK